MSDALEPLRVAPQSVKGQLHAVAMATVVEDVVGEQKKRLRGLLQTEVERLSEETGAAFTARVGGMGSALLTDPQPKVHVSDVQAFGEWLAANDGEALELVVSRERVEVRDHATVAAALFTLLDSEGMNAGDLGKALSDGAIEVVTEWLPAEDAADTLLSKGWAAIHTTDDGLEVRTLDSDTGSLGEAIPGLTVTQAKPTLQVKLDSGARKQARAEVREALGLPALDGGAS